MRGYDVEYEPVLIVKDRVEDTAACRTEGTTMAIIDKRLSEKRKSRRLGFRVNAFIVHNGMKFSGEIRNISDRGVYLATNGPYAVSDSVELTMCFKHGKTNLSVTVPCKVARIDGFGLGLTSSYLDATKLIQLELIFDINKTDSRQLFEEFYKSL